MIVSDGQLLTWSTATSARSKKCTAEEASVPPDQALACMQAQEVTDDIYALLTSAPWWPRYAASQCSSEQAYFTALLFRRDAVAASAPFRSAAFPNSCMGALAGPPTWPVQLPCMQLPATDMHCSSAMLAPVTCCAKCHVAAAGGAHACCWGESGGTESLRALLQGVGCRVCHSHWAGRACSWPPPTLRAPWVMLSS